MLLSDSIVTGFLEASITGAGLVLAVYALIIPMSSRIFKELNKEINENSIEFEKIKNKITPESKKEMKKLKDLSKTVERLKKLPSYLFLSVMISFTFYCVSVFFDSFWFFSPISSADFSMIFIFLVASGAFVVAGTIAIVLVFVPMHNEFVAITKKQKKSYLQEFS